MSRTPTVLSHLGVPYSATALANAFVDATGEDRQPVLALIGAVASQLIADGAPGQWNRFRPHRFFATLTDESVRSRVGKAMRLLGFFHWLWLIGLLRAAQASSISTTIVAVAPGAGLLEELHASLEGDRTDWVRDSLPN